MSDVTGIEDNGLSVGGISITEAVGRFDVVDLFKLLIIFAAAGLLTFVINKMVVASLVGMWDIDLPL